MPLNTVEIKGKTYTIRAIVKEKLVNFPNVVSTLKRKFLPADAVVRKDDNLFVLQEILDIEIEGEKKEEEEIEEKIEEAEEK